MKILFVHNFYQVRGGEDAVYQNEVDLLKTEHEVIEYKVTNNSIKTSRDKFLVLIRLAFSIKIYRRFVLFLKSHNPDIIHIHNYFPLLTPSIFYACKKMKVPVVHTLHNYRSVCPTALLMFDGKIEERSIKKSVWWTIRKKVYRDSLLGSFALACMVTTHKVVGTWSNKVDQFIALTEFSKSKFVEAGWPSNKLAVKPNFIADPFDNEVQLVKKGGYALYVGRLSEEKGINLLFDAWAECELPLKIIGDGPLKELVEKSTAKSIQYLGRKDKAEVIELVKNADFIIMASTWYEGFPMVLVEAFACGTPALVARLGSMEEIVEPYVTGLHFEAGNSENLTEKIKWMVGNPETVRKMGKNARKEYLSKYTPQLNLEVLLGIYHQAIEEAKKT